MIAAMRRREFIALLVGAVGGIRFGLIAISSWRCQLGFRGSRLSSVGQRPRAFRHVDAPRQVGLLRLAH
jgi:hypothetical protein